MNVQHPSTADEADVELYTQGSCHAFAIALHRNLGMRLLVVTEPSLPYGDGDEATPSVVHVLAVDPEGNAWDALGRRGWDAIRDEIMTRHSDVASVAFEVFRTESGLFPYVDGTGDDPDLDRPLHSLSDADIDEAWDCALRILEDVPGFPYTQRMELRR